MILVVFLFSFLIFPHTTSELAIRASEPEYVSNEKFIDWIDEMQTFH